VEIPTVLGIQWRMATASDILTLTGILLIPLMILIIIRLYNRHKRHAIHDSQLFLFRLKRLGLSNFQIKIVNNLVSIIGFTNPNPLLEKAELFESATGKFLAHVRRRGESEDSLTMICKDISIIYDKLYHPSRIKMPLRSVQDIIEDQLIYFMGNGNKVYMGRATSSNNKYLYIKILGNIAEMKPLSNMNPVKFHIFRPGDAEYTFTTTVAGSEGGLLSVEIPQEILRGEDSRHPYIDVIIPAQLSSIGLGDKNQVKMSCTIYRINEWEAVLRINIKLDHDDKYILEFNELDFNFKIPSKIIVQKTVEESGVFYYTLKFEEMSENASQVLKKYMYEHL